MLHIINTLCSITEPFSDAAIESALSDAGKFGFDVESLQKLINITKENLF